MRSACTSFRSRRGFSLIEVMLVLGLLSVCGYFIAGLIKSGELGQKTLLA